MENESIINQIEEACVSGYLTIHSTSEYDVREAFISSINRHGEMTRIHTLNTNGNLLPSVIPFLNTKNIKKVYISKDLTELPEWIHGANSLCILSIKDSNITAIPDWIGDLQTLTELSLDNNSLINLPDSIGKLQSLEKLSLSFNKNLKTLPDSIINLKNLKFINIFGTDIHFVPEFFYSLETFIDNKLIEMIPQSRSISYRSFVNSYYTLIETLYRFYNKAENEGLLALEDELLHFEYDDFLRKGLRLMVDGTDSGILRNLMTLSMEREHDFYRKKLMEVAMEGILGIGGNASVSLYALIILLNSMVNIKNNPIDVACTQYFAGDCDAFSNIDFKAAILPEEEREEISFIMRTAKLSEIARREGILALEKYLDHDKIAARDVFEYGLPLVIDGYENKYIDTVLTNLVEHESDPVQKNIALAKKDAVLSIHAGENTRILALKLMAYFEKDVAKVVEEELLK